MRNTARAPAILAARVGPARRIALHAGVAIFGRQSWEKNGRK